MGTIQITPQSATSTPFWMGEVAAFAQVLEYAASLKAIQEQVRFATQKIHRDSLHDGRLSESCDGWRPLLPRLVEQSEQS